MPTPTASPSATPIPSPTPTPVATPTLSPTATPTLTPVPTPLPTPIPTPSLTPTPAPTPTPTPTPSRTPTPVTAISDARLLADGSSVRIAGTLTTDLGTIDSGRIGFVQDGTDGIALRLDTALAVPIPAGTTVELTGTLGSYFSLRIVNVSAATITVGSSGPIPEPIGTTTGAANEALEGVRLALEGIVTETPGVLADGLGVTIDDGSGPIRIVVGAAALAGQAVGAGDHVSATGPLGQRDSSGTGLAGYRLHVTLPGELSVEAAVPSPTPTASPTPTPSPSPSPSATPNPSPGSSSSASPTPTPTPTPAPTASPSRTPSPSATPTPVPSPTPAAPVAIASARSMAVGNRVTVAGVITAAAGRLGTPALLAIQDATGAIVVRLGDTSPRPTAGTWIEVTGSLANPYGQLEVRSISTFRSIGPAAIPTPVAVDGASLGEAVEAELVTLEGVAAGRPLKSTSGDITFVVTTAHGQVRIAADASAGLATSSVALGDRLRLTGIVGQRASHKDAPDGYRVWVRGATDVVRLAPGGTTASPTPAPTASSPGGVTDSVRTIAAAILAGSGTMTVEGAVTTSASLLDATNRRLVVQDRTAAIEVLLASGASVPPLGATVRVVGEIGRAYGAPRIRATTVRRLGSGAVVPLDLRVAPVAAHEWRLVRVHGDLTEVHRSGDRWTAELLVGGSKVPIAGLAGAGIPSAALVAGRTATIVGIVRRPYPSATDRRFAIVPRSPRDLVIGGPSDGSSTGPAASNRPGSGPGGAGASRPGASSTPGPLDVDLRDLATHAGQTVRVGGLVQTIEADGFRLDDGTAVVAVRLRGPATDVAGSVLVGDALSATGQPEIDPATGAVALVVSDPAGIALVGDLGESSPGPSASDGLAAGVGQLGSDAVPSGVADPGSRLTAGLGDPFVPGVGVLGIVLLGATSLAVTLLRRRRLRRRLAGRIAARLAAIVGSQTGSQTGSQA